MRAHSSTFNFKPTHIKVVVSFVIFAVLFISLGNHFKSIADKNKINLWDKARFDDFYKTPKNTIDMLFIGSSHSYCTFKPSQLDSLLNMNTFQLGMPLQLPDATYFTLLEALEYQKPKTVVMEVYWEILGMDFDIKQVDALFRVMKNNRLKWQFISTFPLKEMLIFNINTIHYQQDFFAYYNALVKEKIDLMFYKESENAVTQTTDTTPVQQGEEYYLSKGYIFSDYTMTQQMLDNIYPNDYKSWDFNKRQKKFLDKIIALCKDKGIELILVTAPVANPVFDKISNYEAVLQKLQSYADDKKVRYLDFNIQNKEKGLFKTENFRDGAHLNDSGAEIAGEFFTEWYTSK